MHRAETSFTKNKAGFFLFKMSIIGAKGEYKMEFNSHYNDIKCKNSEM